jgi:hypothetical protein
MHSRGNTGVVVGGLRSSWAHLVGIHVLHFLALLVSEAVIYAIGWALAQRRWEIEHVDAPVVIMTAHRPVKVGVVGVIDFVLAVQERILGTR